MSYRIGDVDIRVREIGPPRMDFAIGKGQSLFPEWMRINVEVRLNLLADDGRQAFGCSADWPSFGWLDKRPGVAPQQKLIQLLRLLLTARDTIRGQSFEQPFDAWLRFYTDFQSTAGAECAVPLCRSFCAAMMERALIDGYCRIQGLPFHEALRLDRLGFRPGEIHPELDGFALPVHLPAQPQSSIFIRHTVGPSDPLVAADRVGGMRPADDLPHTLEDYLTEEGISHFKIKICGQPDQDLQRLLRIWQVVSSCRPVLTLDGNEAYDDMNQLGQLVDSLAHQSPAMFDCIRLIEQPVNRALTLANNSAAPTRMIARLKPLIIDEADDSLGAFRKAIDLGYQGVSHKNCKGVFKSLANFALCCYRNQQGTNLFQSAEDLTNLPVVALHQDFCVVAALGLTDAERNGHHFFDGLAHLTPAEQSTVMQDYPGMYRTTDHGLQLNIDQGQVDISSLHPITGMGVTRAPDWDAMRSLSDWLAELERLAD